MAAKTISTNRATVLTLWAAVVAQRLGFNEDEALTLGKTLAGLNAQRPKDEGWESSSRTRRSRIRHERRSGANGSGSSFAVGLCQLETPRPASGP